MSSRIRSNIVLPWERVSYFVFRIQYSVFRIQSIAEKYTKCSIQLSASPRPGPGKRRHLAQVRDHPREHLEHVVHVLLGVLPAQAEADGAVGFFMDQPERQEHVGRLERARGAGGAGGDGDALAREPEQDGLSFHVEEADVQGPGQNLFRVTVEAHVRDELLNALA